MTLKLSDVKWIWVVVLAVLTYVASFVLVFGVVLGYSAVLGFQARGAPDPAQINIFADQVAPLVSQAGLILLTFAAALWLARRPKVSGPVNGLVLGFLVGLANLISGSFDPFTIISSLVVVLVGWLGGRLPQC